MKKSEDAVKKIFGKSADELVIEARERAAIQAKADAEKAERLSKEFFETHAGPEELNHLYWLLERLNDQQLSKLARNCGVSSNYDDQERDILVSWLEETNRETFYREYHKILEAK